MVRLYYFIMACISVVGLVYASVLPLKFVSKPYADAIATWQNIPWYRLGLYSRSDWIANALVLIPPSFFSMGFLCFGIRWIWLKVIVSGLLACGFFGLVYGIEFLQIWFPTRTLSLNDIFAGCCGVLIGILTWWISGEWITYRVIEFLFHKTLRERLFSVAVFACVVSGVYSLFPFDFVLSWDELRQKIQIGRISFELLPSSLGLKDFWKAACVSLIRGIPFGFLLSVSKGRMAAQPFLLMVAVSMVIELFQLPVYSKYTSWWDVLFTFLGMIGTFEVGKRVSNHRWLIQSPVMWVVIVLLWTFFTLGFFLDIRALISGDWPFCASSDAKSWRSFLSPPFANHYYTSEYSALTNLLEKGLFFFILGFSVAMLEWSLSGRSSRLGLVASVVLFSVLGFFIEFVQLYQPHQIVDSTDLCCYVVGGLGGLCLTRSVLYGGAIQPRDFIHSEGI